MFWTIVSVVALGLVLLTLGAGLFSLYQGGEFNRQYGNKLMRMRVALQFVAILVLMASLYFSGR